MVPFFPACFSFSHILYALPATVDIWWQILNIVLIKFCSVQIVRVQWDTQLIMCKSNYLYPLFTKYQQKNMQNKGRFQWTQIPENWGWESPSLPLPPTHIEPLRLSWPPFQVDMCRKFMQVATRSMEMGKNLMHGIDACSEVLESVGPDIDDSMRHDCLCTRAGLYLKVCLLYWSPVKLLLHNTYRDHKILIYRGSGKMMFTWQFGIATERGILIAHPIKHTYICQRHYYR